jgi:hypothetical protein
MNVEVEGLPYHSAYDPLQEAKKFYGSYPIEKADVILHFGWGLGYCGEILKSRMKASARVIVFEPDEELFDFARAHQDDLSILEDPRFQFVIGDRVCQFFDQWPLEGCRETDQFLWLVWPSAYQGHRSVATSLQENFKVRLRDRAANLLTHFQNGRLYFKNAMRNFEYQVDPDVGQLFGRFTNLPLIIVAAGPSLDRNIQELRGIEDRCFLLAVDTALRPLLAAGVMPHAVIIADPTELNARHVAGALPESVYLISEQAVDYSALFVASRRFLFGLGLFPDSLCAKFGLAKSPLQVWGSVSTAALDIAWKMGADPIIFAGQDLAFSDDRGYARHTIFDGQPFDVKQQGTHSELDIKGNRIPTCENLIAYRDFCVRKIRQIPGVRFVNATEGGILTEGVEILSLRDAISRYCSKRIDVGAVLEKAYSFRVGNMSQRHALSAISHLRQVLESRQTDCGCLNDFLELTAKEAVLKEDQTVINDNILWGLKVCQEYCRTHADGRVAPLH